ncbi:MAG: efflux RND transporter periplasmic adaptor subunit [Gammaproteobacteria bacterium]
MRAITRHPVLVLFVVALIGLGGFAAHKAMQPPPATGQFQQRGAAQPSVRVESVALRSVADHVESVGTTLANQSIDITAKVAETLSKIHFEDGQLVQQGDLLAELTNAAEASRLAEAQAAADEARRQFTRLEELAKNRLVATTDVSAARTALETAEARLEGVMVAMSDRVVRAPFGGVLGFRQVSPGSLINPGTVITTLDDISVIKLDFTVPEVYLADMQAGMPITARSVVYGEREFRGKIQVVGSRVDPVTRAVQVRAEIDNADGALRPGMLMTLKMDIDTHDALVIAEEAVMVDRNRQYVMVVDDKDIVRRADVKLGRREPGIVEVSAGLAPGDRVVVEGASYVRPGQTVKVLAADTLAAQSS